MEKIDLIFDTDVGSDCDDMMALAYLIYARRNMNVDLKAITHSNGSPYYGPLAIKALFKHAGEELPVLGASRGPHSAPHVYARDVTERFTAPEDDTPLPEAVPVLRKALTESENAIICAVGPFTNIGALLESKGDDISPLDGVSLVREKCRKVVIMAGDFNTHRPEWNVKIDVPASKVLVEKCPVPLVFLPFEAGFDMITGKPVMDAFYDNTPLAMSFTHFPSVPERGGRHSWDPATALYCVEGLGDFFKESAPGVVSVDDEGATFFKECERGTHTILGIKKHEGLTELECKARIAAYIDGISMQL